MLLDSAFYHSDVKPVMAAWSCLWLRAHFIGPCAVEDALVVEYIQGVRIFAL